MLRLLFITRPLPAPYPFQAWDCKTQPMATWIRSARSISTISPGALAAHLAESQPLPLKISRLISHWPALRSWSLRDDLTELRDLIGEQTAVEVELGRRGRGYLDAGYRRITMGFGRSQRPIMAEAGLFLDAFILQKIPSSSPPPMSTGDKGKQRADLPIGYLAQHDLTSSPSLEEAMPTMPHYASGPRQEIWRRTLWVGPEGSWTPFHRDPYIGIYSQLIGSKTFHLLPPSTSPLLDLAPPPHSNTSSIPLPISALFASEPARKPPVDTSDISEDRLERFRTRLKEAFKSPGACQVDLSAGESVLIPEGWYHSAEGTSVGVGVNAWFR